MPNTAPEVTGLQKTVFINSFISMSTLFSVSDADGDAITQYRFLDYNNAATSGLIEVNGTANTNGAPITIQAADLANTFYIGGSQVGDERIRVQAFDGTAWSDPTVLARAYTVRANTTKPVGLIQRVSVLANETRVGTSIFSGRDFDGYPIQRYFIRDRSRDGNYFTLNGSKIRENNFFYVGASQLDDLYYNAVNGGSENLDLYVYDGAQWSNFTSARITRIPNENAPTTNFNSAVVPVDEFVPVDDKLLYFDADGNSIKAIRFWDTNDHVDSGDLVLNGVLQPAKTWINLQESDLPDLQFQGGRVSVSENVRYQVYDGKFWSNVSNLQLNSIPRPVIADERDFFSIQLNNTPLSEVFVKLDDGPAFESYEFFDANTNSLSGSIFLGGFQTTQNQVVEVGAEAFVNGNVVFRSGVWTRRSVDEIYGRAWNGVYWSDWTRVTMRTEPEFNTSLKVPNGSFDDGHNDWDDYRNSSGGLTQLTYSFFQNHPGYESGAATEDNFYRLSAIARDGARMTFDQVESFALVNFTQVADSSINQQTGTQGGDIRIGAYHDFGSGAAAFAFFPGPGQNSGDIWMNIGWDCDEGPPCICQITMAMPPDQDGYSRPPFPDDIPPCTTLPTDMWGIQSPSREIFAHELGHALGLKHPHDASQPPYLPQATDINRFSVMTYTPGPAAPTFGMYDIISLQELYGANMSYRTGNDVYSVDSLAADGNWNIWDAGGIDELNAEDLVAPAFIDLRELSFSNIGPGVGITPGTVIENAVGGRFGDTLIGNDADNVLSGRAGNDSMWGAAGADILRGGPGDDVYAFGIGDDDDLIDEERGAGRDTLEIQPFPELDNIGDLLIRRSGLDLVVSLTLGNDLNQGSVTINRQAWGSFRIETLELGGNRFDLVNIYQQADGFDQRFRATGDSTVFGTIAVPV